jgi:2-polyprenyl-3-methyl-5-hydroxy-6-metoxy-1,4-benzoquinol methylase
MAEADSSRFADLTYESFRQMAADETLSDNERIGFPDSYRAGSDAAILADIEGKLPALAESGRTVVDIGPGCGGLSKLIRERCAENGHSLVFVDSAEMLAHHPEGPGLTKVAARFPDAPELNSSHAGRVDAVIVYSVIQYAFRDVSLFEFVDAALALLAPGGRLLLGDVPNASMRRRFLASEAGRAHHREYSGRDEDPEVRFNAIDRGEIDDAVVLALLLRARSGGFHAWLVPQDPALPMANRREDVLIHRP